MCVGVCICVCICVLLDDIYSQHHCVSFLVFIDPRNIRDLINICSDRVVPNGVNFLPRNYYVSEGNYFCFAKFTFLAFTFLFG